MMAECRYCNFAPNGDIPANRKNLFRYKLLSTKSKDIFLDAIIECTKKGTEVMSIGLDIDRNDTIVKINFCPMCGRKLRKGETNG